MRYTCLSFFIAGMICFSESYADKVVWKGFVSSNGTPTSTAELKLKQRYQIKASGEINLGKWWQGKNALANDACFQYNGPQGPESLASLKNSNDISVCDGKYHESHVYESAPFVPKQNKIHFWVNDEDYSDNTGEFYVQIIELVN